jgi:hypothetical protein
LNFSCECAGFPVQSSINRTLVTSACEDLIVFIAKGNGFADLLQIFTVYGVLSGAILNVQKSAELFVAGWISKIDHPVGLKRNEQNGKNLGVYLGNMTAWTPLETEFEHY